MMLQLEDQANPYGELRGNRLYFQRNRERAIRNLEQAHAELLARLGAAGD